MWSGRERQSPTRCGSIEYSKVPYLAPINTSSGSTQSLAYDNLLLHFKIPSLAQRRTQHDLLFLRNILRCRLNSSVLLDSYPLHVPTRSTRTLSLFAVSRARVRTIETGMFCRIPKAMNTFLSVVPDADVFHDSFSVFRDHVIRYILTL